MAGKAGGGLDMTGRLYPARSRTGKRAIHPGKREEPHQHPPPRSGKRLAMRPVFRHPWEMKSEARPAYMKRGSITGWVIIGLLLILVAGFVVSSFRGSLVMDNSPSTSARTAAQAMANAVNQYAEEYGHLPPLPHSRSDHDTETSSGAEEKLVFILSGKGHAANPGRMNFLGDFKDAVESADGLVRAGDTAALMDPWRLPYHILLDTDGDGVIKDPESGSPVHRKVLVWSAGKDGDFKTWKDNVSTWRIR
jgi:hypothetical protein